MAFTLRPGLVLLLLCAAASLWMFFIDPHYEVASGVTLRVLSGVPFLMGVWILVEFPPPGRGTGKQAGTLPDLKSVGTGHPLPPLGKGGALLEGHAYVIVFFNTTPRCVHALQRVDKIVKATSSSASWLHVVLVSHDALPKLENLAKRWPKRQAPMAHDAAGTATTNYVVEHGAWVVPHVFIVGTDGIITWHGQINRPQLGPACAAMVRRAHAKGEPDKVAGSKKDR